ncbi:hypothetical protein NIES37_44620 [Tolypothrix tenuis PCC 7101]|uniref:Uncharacterized protein n=1 Tax=Tolypothrix tenuis PCC 7101 TaxID=231146 RepID=A0A1Z4N405_9CYAN|nr:hypothetical protein [Aulosira sp. FACHB-113]BAZ00470.1 hypothetical protein NIES37_44620 [Tolypothrix tenuis PCC 7101]BAZ75608.1 hypothetical protein NIES50_41960 [Aulosira laxa NIES-50]
MGDEYKVGIPNDYLNANIRDIFEDEPFYCFWLSEPNIYILESLIIGICLLILGFLIRKKQLIDIAALFFLGSVFFAVLGIGMNLAGTTGIKLVPKLTGIILQACTPEPPEEPMICDDLYGLYQCFHSLKKMVIANILVISAIVLFLGIWVKHKRTLQVAFLFCLITSLFSLILY